MQAAAMNDAIASPTMTVPISEKAYASSRRPRSVVPWNDVGRLAVAMEVPVIRR